MDGRFSIRSFGSWGEAHQLLYEAVSAPDSFSIRSFGSWGEADVRGVVGCKVIVVSVSALSDRGVRQVWETPYLPQMWACFSIRSFGSWGEAPINFTHVSHVTGFQYPLFRIVG